MAISFDSMAGRLEHTYAKKIDTTVLETRITSLQSDLDDAESLLTTEEIRLRRLERNLRVFLLQKRT